jgi:outer membrane lipoprotein-sorting protein
MTVRSFIQLFLGMVVASAPLLAQGTFTLEDVLGKMVEAGSELTTLEARVDRDTVNALVDDHDLNAGTVYFDASGGESRIRLNITEPDIVRQEVLVADGQFQSYNPRTNQVSRGTLEGPSDIAQFLVVGFGPGNASLDSNFEIELVGEEDLDGVPTLLLELIPRSDEVLSRISKIQLWIDLDRWIPLQQRLEQPSLNYQIVKYSEIELDADIPESTFDLDLPDDVNILLLN